MKVLAREFLWLFISLILSLPLGLAFLWYFGFTSETVNLAETERNYAFWMYLVGYFTSFLGIYIMRFVAMAIQTLAKPEEPAPEE
jgi:hypothetical protein